MNERRVEGDTGKSPRTTGTETAEHGAPSGGRPAATAAADDTAQVSIPPEAEVASGLSMDEANPPRSAAHILFLACFSTQSGLVEKALRARGNHVTIVPDLDTLHQEWQLGIYDLIVLDHAVALNDKLQILKLSLEQRRPTPIIMIFEPDTEHEAQLAMSSGATGCVVRDSYGEYLLKIPKLVDAMAKLSKLAATRVVVRDNVEFLDETTDRIDLQSLADEVREMTSRPQTAGLIVLGGPDVGKTVEVGSAVCIIGRDPTCQLRLNDESISRFHASVKKLPNGAVVLKDLDSTNGTYIDGRRIRIATLKDGDRVLLGQSSFVKFQLQDAIDANYFDELYYSSTRDGLTGLYNRRSCLEMMKTNMAYSKRHQRPVALLMIDIDHFKDVNDTYGHPAGDLVLSAVAQCIDSKTRTEDVLGRYGGEEFILFALDTNAQMASVLAERVRKCVQQQIVTTRDTDPFEISVTISIGIAEVSPGEEYDLESLIEAADANLYRAKEKSRNCVVGPDDRTHAVVLGQLKR